jgi:hypothetical protein
MGQLAGTVAFIGRNCHILKNRKFQNKFQVVSLCKICTEYIHSTINRTSFGIKFVLKHFLYFQKFQFYFLAWPDLYVILYIVNLKPPKIQKYNARRYNPSNRYVKYALRKSKYTESNVARKTICFGFG